VPNNPLRVCLVGATGRMGTLIATEAPKDRFVITGAVAAPDDRGIGRTLSQLGVRESDIEVSAPSRLPSLLRESDVCVSFTSAQAEMKNLPDVVEAGVPFVMGTTGFTPEERSKIISSLSGRVPAVVASNFSIGANLLIALSAALESLPRGWDVSIVEAHHSGKADAPSGTALSIAEAASKARKYTRMVHGRSGTSKRTPEEIEVVSLRGGGTPGVHTVFAFGPHEMLKMEHVAFSRSSFALGALQAAEWVSAKGREPRVYGMAEVLGLRL
jgi:4-hydroxy-tetrahydrodipicolinate reductase